MNIMNNSTTFATSVSWGKCVTPSLVRDKTNPGLKDLPSWLFLWRVVSYVVFCWLGLPRQGCGTNGSVFGNKDTLHASYAAYHWRFNSLVAGSEPLLPVYVTESRNSFLTAWVASLELNDRLQWRRPLFCEQETGYGHIGLCFGNFT